MRGIDIRIEGLLLILILAKDRSKQSSPISAFLDNL